jgi:hypothetical protein
MPYKYNTGSTVKVSLGYGLHHIGKITAKHGSPSNPKYKVSGFGEVLHEKQITSRAPSKKTKKTSKKVDWRINYTIGKKRVQTRPAAYASKAAAKAALKEISAEHKRSFPRIVKASV